MFFLLICRSEEAQSDSSTVTVLFTNGEQMEDERAAVTVQKGRSPIDAWPDAFIFFDRYVRTYIRAIYNINIGMMHFSIAIASISIS